MAVIELTTVRCKTCGTVLDEAIRSAVNGVVICPSCTHVWTVARKEATSETLGFLQIGEHDLDVGKYDDAFAAYQKAAELDPKEPEAYFGMALAEFKIRYLKDHTANRLQPICGEVPDKQFLDSNAYLRAMLNATPEQKVEYEKRGKEIDYILGEFRKYQKSGKKYDSFICVKVTDDEMKQPTADSRDAEYIYRLLKEKGYAPFYSELELRNETGADYEARILYALHTAECMLVVCRNADYLQTPWVKNEYTRFLKLVNDEEKESDSITIVFNGKPIEKLPGRAGKIQGINLASYEAYEKIVNFVDLHTPEARKRREEEERKTAEKEKIILQRIEEQKRQQKELEDQLKSLKGGSGVQATASSLLTRGYQELAAKELRKADQFFDRVLEAEPEHAEAWWGKLLVELNLWNDNQVGENLSEEAFDTISKSRNYKNAKRYASGEFKERFDKIQNRLSEVAQVRTKKLEEKVDVLNKQTSEDQQKFHNFKVSKQSGRLKEAPKEKEELEKELKALPKLSKPDSIFYSLVCFGLVIGGLVAVVFFIYNCALSYIYTAEEAKELSVWITWNNYDGYGDYGNSFVGFILAVARALAYGVGLLAFFSFLGLPSLIRYKAKEKKYLQNEQRKERLASQIEALKNEIKKQTNMIEAETQLFNNRENMREKERTELNQSIGIYKAFL